jgi:hypothetical protein
MLLKKFRTLIVVALLGAGLALTACSSQSDTVSHNISNDADNYRIYRDIVFYNGITDKYIAEFKGYCSLGNDDKSGELTYTCKVGPDTYIKNFLGLSDNVTYFALQTVPSTADPYHYEVNFTPETVIPDIQFHHSK